MTTLDEARAALQRHARGPAFVAALEAFEAAVRANERGGTTQAADLRDRIAAALYERERPPRDPHWVDAFAADREVFEAMADAVLAVLPPPADRAAVVADDEGDELVCVDQCGSCDACGMEPFGTPAEGWRQAAHFLRRAARESGDRSGALHGARLIEAELRRLADAAQQPGTLPLASTAPLAAGLPLVKGNCPACNSASLFLGNGGYVTCSRIDCPEPDAATTVLELSQSDAEHTPEAAWYILTHQRGGWRPWLAPRLDRAEAREDYDRCVAESGHRWAFRLVRETSTYTVEAEHQPAAQAQPS
ncbi:hypothetical protein [Streptomyces nigra]|uniref:hypothetical protein n=1 Tax=Streptomyces nigra TaxID=1827580 RepID=UPI003641A9B7